MDREKVIKGKEHLDAIMEVATHLNYPDYGVAQDHCLAILSLLKEQETEDGHWIVLEYCANEGIYCSECHMKIFDRTTKPKKKLSQYCPHCGRKVKWND